MTEKFLAASKRLRKSELTTIMEEEGIPVPSDDEEKEEKEEIDVMQVDFSDEEEQLLTNKQQDPKLIKLRARFHRQLNEFEQLMEQIKPTQSPGPRLVSKQVVPRVHQQPEQSKPNDDQVNHLKAWRIVEVTGLSSGILTTFTSHFYGLNLFLPVSIYSGGIFAAAIALFGLYDMGRLPGSLWRNCANGCLKGLNVALNHLVFFLLPIGAYGTYKWYIKDQ